MKRFTLFLFILCSLSLSAKTVYLNTGGGELWNQADAKFYVHSWSGANYADLQMQLVEGDVYSVNISDSHNQIIFLRLSPNATGLVWDGENFWNKTGDLTIPSGQNCYTITGWGVTVP